jgi:hypothetical protein
MDLTATTTEGAQANVAETCKFQADFRNADLKTIYLGAFNNWAMSVEAGRSDTSNPPRPPKGYTVKTDADGWAYVTLGDQPVCDMPALPADHSAPIVPIAGAVDIGAETTTPGWFVVGPHDGTKPGVVVTLPVGKFLRVGSIFGGTTGWYERLS